MRYSDFVLWAREPQVVRAATKRLTFSVLVPGVLDAATACELDMTTLEPLKEKVTSPDATWDDAGALGQALANALLPAEVWSSLSNRITQAQAVKEGVRIRLILSGSELSNWPWEFMLFNRGGGEVKTSDFLALLPNVSLVRHDANPLPAWRLEANPPVKVMVAVASPRGWPKLKVSEERTIIEKALQGNSQISVASQEHALKTSLPDRIKPAHIFHFAGHGKFKTMQSAVPGANEGKASIVLEDQYGDQDEFDAELLAVQLRDAGVRLAVLGACQTAQRDDVNDWSSVAEALLKAELGAVVGMQFPVRDESAICFAERFYAALAIGLSIDDAVAAGRVAVALSNDPRGWANPALYLRSPDGVIFASIAANPELESARKEATVKSYQRINELSGKAIALKIGEIQAGGSAESTQIISTVNKGATAIGMDVGTVRGAVVSRQEIDEVEGDAIGASIDELG